MVEIRAVKNLSNHCLEIFVGDSGGHYPTEVSGLHGLFKRVHHGPNFVPIKDSILIRVKVMELLLES